MGPVVGEIVLLAVGVAVSPLPIIAVVLMLLSRRPRSASLAFAVGCTALIASATTLFTVIGDAADSGSSRPTFMYWVDAAAGLALLVVGVRTWRTRNKTSEPPSWLASVDDMSMLKALGTGLAITIANPKNLVLFAAAGAAIGAADFDGLQTTTAVMIYTVLAGSSVLVPTIAFLIAPAVMAPRLVTAKAWLEAHSTTMVAILVLVIGVALGVKGFGGLLGFAQAV
ncbi:GAP family protein [Gordonia malaquae]|uniref:GAP family protein n=1 Tax=Gordonia malaquae TaxID=410332 RepID=UPI0030C79E10